MPEPAQESQQGTASTVCRVLCVAKVRSGGHAYYLEVVDTGVEAPGEWMTAGAGQLDLGGTVGSRELEAVLEGRSPSSGEVLGTARERVKVAGFDLTFCAPKSVSLLHALGDEEVAAEVRSGHQEAVSNAISYVERHALAVRRVTDQARIPQAVEGVAGAAFVHRTSRALDPHLHTHVVVANLGRSVDGMWSALDGRGVYAHAPAAGALYHAQLRYELTRRLGIDWEPLIRGRADIAGIGVSVRRQFSSRTAEIEAHLVERGIGGDRRAHSGPSHRAREVAAFATRAARDPTLSVESLRGWWRERAVEAGLTPRALEATLGRARATGIVETKEIEGRVLGYLEDLGRSVTRRDVVRASCSVLEKGAPSQVVERSADELLAGLEPLDAPGGGRPCLRDAPGVGERRHRVIEHELERGVEREVERVVEHEVERGVGRGVDDTPGEAGFSRIEREASLELERLDRVLAARGLSRADERTLGLERGAGPGLGL